MGISNALPDLMQAIKDPEAFEVTQTQVINRVLNYHRRCLPEQFLKENMREWEEMCDLVEARVRMQTGIAKIPERPPYPFTGLLDLFANEWLDESLTIGGLRSLQDDPIASSLERWIRSARSRNRKRVSDPGYA